MADQENPYVDPEVSNNNPPVDYSDFSKTPPADKPIVGDGPPNHIIGDGQPAYTVGDYPPNRQFGDFPQGPIVGDLPPGQVVGDFPQQPPVAPGFTPPAQPVGPPLYGSHSNPLSYSHTPAPHDTFLSRKWSDFSEILLGILAILFTGIAVIPVTFVVLLKLQEKGIANVFTSPLAERKVRINARAAELALIGIGLFFFFLYVLVVAFV